MNAQRGGQGASYRPIDPDRARRVRTSAVGFGSGAIVLGAAVLATVLALALGWVDETALFAMTAGTHGALALIAVIFGFVTISARGAITTKLLDVTAAARIRRNLLVLWNFGILLACLGWLAFGAGIDLSRQPITAGMTIAEVVLPAALVIYLGVVTVLTSRRLLS